MTISPPSVLVGAQTPRLRSVPPFATSAGEDAIGIADAAGLVLDPWQQLVLRESLGEDAEGNWSAFEVGLVVSRQSGKGAIIEARELAGLYLFSDRLILHSAHEVKTALEAFNRIRQLIESTPDLDSRVARVVHTNGSEGIELKNGSRLKFVARSTGSGRGFSADCVILDEAFHLREASMNAMLPTLSARANPQIWYVSTAVNAREHQQGRVLARIRERGMKGDDPSLAYFEWSADPDRFEVDGPQDRELWAQANPGLGIRISADYIEREQRSMTPEGFAVERLGVGLWPSGDGHDGVIDADVWAAAADVDSDLASAPVFAVDVAPDRSAASIAVAGRRADGSWHVEVIDSKAGTSWVADRCAGLCADHGGDLVVDPGAPAGALIPALEAADVPLRLMRTRDVVQACGMFFDAVSSSSLRHLDQSPLNAAVAGASQRTVGEAWAWSRRNAAVDITPLVAATNALWGAGTSDEPPDYDVSLSVF